MVTEYAAGTAAQLASVDLGDCYPAGANVTLQADAYVSQFASGVAKFFTHYILDEPYAGSTSGYLSIGTGHQMVSDSVAGDELDQAFIFGQHAIVLAQTTRYLYFVIEPQYASAPWYSNGSSSLSVASAPDQAAVDCSPALADPLPGYWIDWAGDGFDDGSGGTAVTEDPRLARGLPQAASVGTASGGDNVTSYVLASSWYRGGSYDHVGANGPGGFTILLDNSTGRFDPDNTTSDLYGLMRPGLPVWAGAIAATGAVGTANGTGTVAGFLAGTVREFVPTVDASGRRVCEVIGEDAFGPYSRATVSVEPSLTRSHQAFRALILDGLGEDNARRDLAVENGTMPFSAVESADGLDVLEELNRATATRHFIRPADSKEDWYDYVTVNKLHKLQAAADQTLDGDDITNVTGWRITNDNLIEVQRATVVPIDLTPDNAEVWAYEDVPFTMSAVRPKLIWANFDDYVFDASVDVDFTSGSGTANITNYGKTAQVGIWATSANATIGRVRILGQQVVRGDSITVVAGDESAGALAGSVISSDFIGQSGAAQGLVDFIVWKFGQPLKRPALTVVGKNAATLSTIFSRDLYDVMTLSIDKLSVTSRRVEIIGLRGSHVPGRSGDGIWSVNYELQETPNQSAVDWFDVNTDSINGAQVIAPF